jgi:hypothetical protein
MAMKPFFWSSLAGILLFLPPAWSQRVTLPLDGLWQIEDSVSATEIPAAFGHHVPVPGLADLASPAFEDVDRFVSHELAHHPITRPKDLPPAAAQAPVGIPLQKRNYFWYRRTFEAPAKKQVAILRINKAQFGTAVWLNGKKIGEHDGCFSAGYFNLTAAMHWNEPNVLLVRIGAHPAVVPLNVPAGTDFEKLRWTPGIYDRVTLLLSDNPVVESVQVAPRIDTSSIVVQTVLHNYGVAVSVPLKQSVKTWQDGTLAVEAAPEQVQLGPGESKTVEQTIRIPDAKLWSPEDPFLYTLETNTGGDSATTRFGMREFRFDPVSKRAMLNGKVYFMRGSNIALHRFFEDPERKGLPWDEQWVRRLLIDIPKRMHWNSFRFCIGPVPDRWLEIADEAGLLIQNEFFIWTGGEGWVNWHKEWDADSLIGQYKEWMRDNWNHPSVAIWGACNETLAPILAEKVIPAVRGLDLSNRPWENGSNGPTYNRPAGPSDPESQHPYLFGERGFRPVALEKMDGAPPPGATHPAILNEYGYLWLSRDGSPTTLTKRIYARLLGPNATGEERLEAYAYYVAGLTEFWRAHRHFAGVLHFVYLTGSRPDAFTGDNFQDVKTLRLEPNFENWVGEAFKPLGVYINFWQPKIAPGAEREFPIMMINDGERSASGKLALAFVSGNGEEVERTETAFVLPAAGETTLSLKLRAPAQPGKYLLKASAAAAGGEAPTLSRRKVEVEAVSH